MKKRRRAYKKYDWRQHCMKLLSDQLNKAINEQVAKSLDMCILYGVQAVAYRTTETTLKAGLWKVTVPINEPYLIKKSP